MFLAKIRKIKKKNQVKIVMFYSCKNRCILHRRVMVMVLSGRHGRLSQLMTGKIIL